MAADAPAPSERAGQVRIQLRTSDDGITLPHNTGAILVSTEFKRFQLSTLVNRLLETSQPVPLEFLVNGQFLRTSLDDALTQHGISAEATLTVEYVRALSPPLHVASFSHDDWISGIDVLPSTRNVDAQARLLSASFDGSLRVWDSSARVLATGHRHTGRATAARFLSGSRVVSAGIDRSLLVWDFRSAGDAHSLTPVLDLCGHTSPVHGLAVHEASHRVLSASQDHRIGVWTTDEAEAPPPPPEPAAATPQVKRRKLSAAASASSPLLQRRGALAMLHSHRDAVRGVCFDARDRTVAYSASQDHAVKTWDLAVGECVDTRVTGSSLAGVCHLPARSLVAAAGADRTVTLVDPRVSASTVAALLLRGHSAAVNSVARHPDRDHLLVSAGNDATCRVWDLRSSARAAGPTAQMVGQCVFVIERASTSAATAKPQPGDAARVFSVCWDADVGIVSGGRDKMLQINRAQSP